jgi:hypothetical protein
MSLVLMIAAALTSAGVAYYQVSIENEQAAIVAKEASSAAAGLRNYASDHFSDYASPANYVVGPGYELPAPAIAGIANPFKPTAIELQALGYLDKNVGIDWVFTIRNDGGVGNSFQLDPQAFIHGGWASPTCSKTTYNAATALYRTNNSACDTVIMGQKITPYLRSDHTANISLLAKAVRIIGNIGGYSAEAIFAFGTSNDGISIRGAQNKWQMNVVDANGVATTNGAVGMGVPAYCANPVYMANEPSCHPVATPTLAGYLGFFDTINTSNYRSMLKQVGDLRIPDVLNGVSVAGNTSLQKLTNVGVLQTINGYDASFTAVTGQFNSVGLISGMNLLSSSVNSINTSCASTTIGALSKTATGLALSCISSPTQGQLWKLTAEVACPSGGALVTISKPVVVPFGCNNVEIIAVGGGGAGGGGFPGNGTSSTWGICTGGGTDGFSGTGGGTGLAAGITMPYGSAAGKMFYFDIGQGGHGVYAGAGGAGTATSVSEVGGTPFLIGNGGAGGWWAQLYPTGLSGQGATVPPWSMIYNPFATFISPGGAGGNVGVAGTWYSTLVNNVFNAITFAVTYIISFVNGILNVASELIFKQAGGLPAGSPANPGAERDGLGGFWGAMGAGGGGGGGGAGATCFFGNPGFGSVGGDGGAGYAIIAWTK